MIAAPPRTPMAPPRHRHIVMAAAFAASMFAGAANAQAPSLDEIRREVERGRSDVAWPMCAGVDRLAQPRADLWCGITAVDTGRPGEGVL